MTESTEVIDRLRRIETKLSRFICGEDDKGVTKLEHKLRYLGAFRYELELQTANITLVQLVQIIKEQVLFHGSKVDVYDNARFIVTVDWKE